MESSNACAYWEITSQLGLGYELFGICAVGRQQWGGISLMREIGRPDFDAREVALLQQIVPQLGSGLKAALLRTQASTEPKATCAPGVLVLDEAAFGAEERDAWVVLTYVEPSSGSQGEHLPANVPTPPDSWFSLIEQRVFESEREVKYYFVVPLLE